MCKNREKLENIISIYIFGELAQRFSPLYFIALLKTLVVCFKAEKVKNLLLWGKIFKFCTKIARNRKILSASIFVVTFALRFDCCTLKPKNIY